VARQRVSAGGPARLIRANALPPTLTDFGHASLTIGGRLAAGGRRLLVVLVDYSENPPISVAHANRYYELLAFGDPTPPFSTDSPVNPASLREYFRENSYGRFWFDSVGLVGPLNMGALGPDPGPVARCTAIMQSVAQTSPGSFFASDTDADHVVAQNEMSVVLVENFPGAQPDISGHNPVQATIQVGPITVALTVNVILAGVGPYTPFYQIAHELSHATVGTVDMYNSGKGNYGMTLMSGYSFTSNDQYSVHTDGVGGLTDRGVFYGITANGDLEWNCYNGNGAQIGGPGSGQNWHPNTGNLIGRGWGQMLHVVGCGNGTVLAVNANGNLHWYSYSGNGESDVTGAAGWDANSGNVIGNGWQNFLHVCAIPSSGASGSMIQVFAVDPDGRLLWYGYTGNGEHDPSGHKGWVPNSGHQVGAGWTGFRHIHASSNVLFAIKNDGTLYWYCYEGHGESDPTGGKGWRLNSGNPVGTGWQSMQHVFGGVSDTPSFAHIVMGVDIDGYLRWYRYTGQGESDISGAQGWDARSGSRIGASW
jgi:hypothetical protein